MYKIIDEKAFPTERYCRVTIQSKEGRFTGWSYCHRDDEFSTFAGIKYAEKRAVAAMCKKKARIARIQLRTVKNLKKDIVFRDETDFYLDHAIKIKIRDYDNAVKHWTKVANDLEQSVLLDDKERASILSRYSHKDQAN